MVWGWGMKVDETFHRSARSAVSSGGGDADSVSGPTESEFRRRGKLGEARIANEGLNQDLGEWFAGTSRLLQVSAGE